MTARFFRRALPWESYAATTGLIPPPGIDPPEEKANIAPGSWVPVIRRAPHGPRAVEMALMLWGLVPGWWSKPLSEKRWTSFNARAEGIGEAAAFRGAFRYRRCLVPASGFLVWSGAEGRRVPFAIGLRDAEWVALGGIWECWGHDGAEIDTLAIVTVPANDLVAAHAERMPLILDPRDHSRWLDGREDDASALCRPFDPAAMVEWPVDPAIGDVRNQGFGLIGGPREQIARNPCRNAAWCCLRNISRNLSASAQRSPYGVCTAAGSVVPFIASLRLWKTTSGVACRRAFPWRTARQTAFLHSDEGRNTMSTADFAREREVLRGRVRLLWFGCAVGALTLVLPLSPILLLAYLWRPMAEDTRFESHIARMITSYWIALVLILVAAVFAQGAFAVAVTIAGLACAFLLIVSVVGLRRVAQDRRYPPLSRVFGLRRSMS